MEFYFVRSRFFFDFVGRVFISRFIGFNGIVVLVLWSGDLFFGVRVLCEGSVVNAVGVIVSLFGVSFGGLYGFFRGKSFGLLEKVCLLVEDELGVYVELIEKGFVFGYFCSWFNFVV